MPARVPVGTPLVGRLVRLDPMVPGDAEGLFPIMSDPAAFGSGYPFETAHVDLARTREFVGDRMAPGAWPYTVRVDSPGLDEVGKVAGTSSFTEIDTRNEKLQLGWTFYGRRYWASGVNVETKLLLLSHAFEDLGFGRVKLQADVRNERSRAAITRLGARFEGVTRRDVLREDGTWRDTAVYSITVDEWQTCRVALEERLRAVLR